MQGIESILPGQTIDIMLIDKPLSSEAIPKKGKLRIDIALKSLLKLRKDFIFSTINPEEALILIY